MKYKNKEELIGTLKRIPINTKFELLGKEEKYNLCFIKKTDKEIYVYKKIFDCLSYTEVIDINRCAKKIMNGLKYGDKFVKSEM